MKYLLITAGCAECSFPPDGDLIQMRGPFDTIEEAKAAVWNGANRIGDDEWIEHLQGGICYQDGQGMDWIFPVPDGFEVKTLEATDG